MRKICPFCGVQLIISEAKNRGPWVLASCSQCSNLSVTKFSPKAYASRPKRVFNLKKIRSQSNGVSVTETRLQKCADLVIGVASHIHPSFLIIPLVVFALGAGIYFWRTPNQMSSTLAQVTYEERPVHLSEAAAITSIQARELVAQITVRTAILRAGPGTSFRIVGSATGETKWKIKSSRDGWYEVVPMRISFGKKGVQSEFSAAWIRKDLVKLAETESSNEVSP